MHLLFLVCALSFWSPALSSSFPCEGGALVDEDALDAAYSRSEFVFAARISRAENQPTDVGRFQLLAPAIKGDVPSEGTLVFGACSPWYGSSMNDAVLLLFLDNFEMRVTQDDGIIWQLTDFGPGYSWVTNWIKRKQPGS